MGGSARTSGSHTLLPWRLKLAAKLFLGLLPVSYEKLRATLTGYRGGMGDPAYAEATFNKHFEQHKRYDQEGQPGTFLELGPGGSLTNGILALSKGFKTCVLIDVGNFASADKRIYEEALKRHLPDKANALKSRGRSLNRLEALEEFDIHYETQGLRSLKQVPSASVSLSFSQAVFEHVRFDEFEETLRELFRVHRKGTVSSHRVDFKDHLGGSLNNMRFSRKLWESKLFPNDGFYTNRLRYCDVRDACRKAGFEIVSEELEKWDDLPLEKQKMAREFQRYKDNDLLIKGADIVLRVPKD